MKAKIILNVKSLRIPREMPSKFMITWKCDPFQGQTRNFCINGPLKQLDESFQIDTSMTTEDSIEFVIHAKSLREEVLKIGNSKIKIPQNKEFEKYIDDVVKIESGTGVFDINISFEFKQNDKIVFDKDDSLLLKKISNVTQYCELIKNLPVELDVKKAKTFYYSEELIPKYISSLKYCDDEDEAKNELNTALPFLESKACKAYNLSMITREICMMLMSSEPKFVTNDLEIIYEHSRLKEVSDKVPLMFLYTVKFIDSYIEKNLPIKEIESTLIQIFTLFVTVSLGEKATNDWLFYLLSTILHIKKYLNYKYPTELPYIIGVLSIPLNSNIVQILEFTKNEIIKRLKSINGIKTLFRQKENLFLMNSISHEVWNLIKEFLCDVIDYLLAKKIVFDETIPFPIFDEYMNGLPQGGKWNLLNGISYIVENAKNIYSKKIKISQLPKSLTGTWLKLIFKKLSIFNKNKYIYKSKNINSLSDPSIIDPEMPDSEEWVHSHNFIDLFSLPPNIPDLKIFKIQK